MSSSGVRIHNQRGLRASKPKPISQSARRAARGVAAAKVRGDGATTQSLLGALQQQELVATHEFTLVPGPGDKRSLRGARGARSLDVEVDVGATQSAVVLVEQDGEYSWHFPEPSAPTRKALRSAAKRGIAAAAAAPSSVTIPVRLPAAKRRAAPGRRALRVGAVWSAAKGVVLKFVARTAAGVVMRQLERNVRRGLIVMDSDDPNAWRRVETLNDLGLPQEPLRIMLWIHGTFSSTVGGFAALTSTPEGKALLGRAREQYHAVIGFDHPTLSLTPLENAVDLIERLGRFERPMRIDAVMHSRGGLVYRSLVELLLPTSAKRPELGPAVFVAVPNSGTSLAEPSNWRALVDLYTNLTTGASRLLGLLPGASVPAGILSEAVSGLGALVKYLADVVITERRVPGLAAMEPDGEFIKALNAAGAGQPLPDQCRYLAVTSNFDSKAALNGQKPTGLAGNFLGRLADGFIDRLFRANNDLVIDELSMKRIDPSVGTFIDASLDFGDSPIVYHTVYFAQAQVALQLNAWLLDSKARDGLMARRGLLSMRKSGRTPFTRVRYHRSTEAAPRTMMAAAADKGASARRGVGRRPKRALAARELEGAASAHLSELFGLRQPASVQRGIRRAAPRAPNYAPALEHTTTQVSRLGPSRNVHVLSFQQAHRAIPIFGTKAVIELDDAGGLVAAQARLAKVGAMSAEAKLEDEQAGQKLARVLKVPASASKAWLENRPALNFFHDRAHDLWHLVYVFRDVGVAPPHNGSSRGAARRGNGRARDGHGIGPSPRQRFPLFDYLVDANDGELVYYYSVAPTAARRAPAALPGVLRGSDDEGVVQRFFGLANGAGFELRDPTRFIRTHDLTGGDVDTAQVPRNPIRSAKADFGTASAAGVSAHVNSGHVFDFFNSVLIRRGVDDLGSDVINVVNCTSAADEPPPQWANAIWYKKKMWYGQIVDQRGQRRSLARYLDIIAHELTHGITEATCNLVYREESGALNESFSDIFGVIIANHTKRPGADTRDWDWQIGAGLGDTPKKPLRDLSNPRLTGDPDHTRDMSRLRPGETPNDDNDMGFVHTNSNIHNKAAYNLLVAAVPGAGRKRAPLVFDPRDVARLYYFTLQRLDRIATFDDVFFTLSDVARTVFPDPQEQKEKLAAITAAYAAVGIPQPAAGANGRRPRRGGRRAAAVKRR